MLFTIGYQRLSPSELLAVIDTLKVTHLIDVRSSPRTRKPGYSMAQLETFFGKRYMFAGDRLGGRAQIKPAALDWLADFAKRRRVAIMCMEEVPGNCHRHVTIALPLLDRGMETHHIFGNDIIKASELERAINDDDDYEIAGNVFPENDLAST